MNNIPFIYILKRDTIDKDWKYRLLESIKSVRNNTDYNTIIYLSDFSKDELTDREILDKVDSYIHKHYDGPFNRSLSINYAYKQFIMNKYPNFIIIDLDIVVPPNYISGLLNEQKSNEMVLTKLYYLPYGFYRKHGLQSVYYLNDSIKKFSGGSYLCNSNVFEIIKGLDESYVAWGYEDYDFFFRYNQISKVIESDVKSAHIYHPPNHRIFTKLVDMNRERFNKRKNGILAAHNPKIWGEI